jgi:hypothetical protein
MKDAGLHCELSGQIVPGDDIAFETVSITASISQYHSILPNQSLRLN